MHPKKELLSILWNENETVTAAIYFQQLDKLKAEFTALIVCVVIENYLQLITNPLLLSCILISGCKNLTALRRSNFIALSSVDTMSPALRRNHQFEDFHRQGFPSVPKIGVIYVFIYSPIMRV